MDGWSLSIGLCPGMLLGIRTYSYDDGYDHALYVGCFMLILSTYYD